MTGDSEPVTRWQGYVPEDSLAIIKLITTGQRSRKYYLSIDPSVVGLDCIFNVPEIHTDNEQHIRGLIEDTDMLFVAVSIEEPTEVEVAKEILAVAQSLGISTIAIALGAKQSRSENIDSGHDFASVLIEKHLGATLFIPPVPLPKVNDWQEPLGIAAVRAVVELIMRPGLMGIDYADVKTVVTIQGMARVGQGLAVGKNRAVVAAEHAMSDLLLNKTGLSEAEAVLINITAGLDMHIQEMDDVLLAVKAHCSDDVTVAIGMPLNPDMGDDMRVTVIAIGIEQPTEIIGSNMEMTAS